MEVLSHRNLGTRSGTMKLFVSFLWPFQIMKVWDLVTGRLLQTRAFPLPITAIVVDPTKMKLFSGGIDY
ncbi:unnamed protein product [Camellia sinensis]